MPKPPSPWLILLMCKLIAHFPIEDILSCHWPTHCSQVTRYVNMCLTEQKN